MSLFADGSTVGGGWRLIRRLASVLALGTSLVAGSTSPAMAQRAAARGGRAVGAAHTSGRAVSTPRGNAAVVHQGRAVSTPRGTAYVGRTAVVRTGPRPYTRAPYAYGGHRYYAYHPYAYHRYTPYYWGPAYHPVGAFVGTLAATAVLVSVANTHYRYEQGVWYLPSGDGYKVVAAPIGATVAALPQGALAVGGGQYYYAGAYYQQTSGGYIVVAPQAGMVVDQLPPGGEVVTVGNQQYIRFGQTYYQPIEVGGQPKYEVVEVR
jgi:hypothetical protein